MSPTAPVDRSFVATAVVEAQTWVEPVDDQCPVGFPIEADDSSVILNTPNGRSYVRTIPSAANADADDAIANGYRAAKV